MQSGGATEAASLMRWLVFYARDEQEGCLEIALRLLKLAFPDAEPLDGWKYVVATLEGFYETSLGVDADILIETRLELNGALKKVLELLLAALVQCEAKETFVKDILSLEDAVQADLMSIIERIMTRGASDEQEEAVEVVKIQKEPALGSPLYLSRNATLERVKRENGVLKDENIHLAREAESATAKCRSVESEKEKLVEVVKQLKEQLEADGLRRERSMHAQYDERIQALQKELDSAKTELQEQSALASGVPALRDEVDLLRPMAEKRAKMDATMAKYKAKIDELAGAKDRLRHLEGTNAELVGKNLALESELAKAAVWKRKLKEAKQANTDVEFRVAELETLLTRERQENASATADLQGALDEVNALNAQLQQSVGDGLSASAIEISTSGPPMAGGLCEFSPELMQKLTRLEHENAELKKQLDGETAARIDTLLDEIDDLSRLKKSFEGRFFATQEALHSTQSELERTTKEYARAVAEHLARSGELAEWKLCLEEDVSAHAKEKADLVSTRDRLAQELGRRSGQVHQLTTALSSRDRELITQQGGLKALSCRNSRLMEQCERLLMSKEDLKAKFRAATQAFEASLARQLEYAAMQMEDAHADRLRYRQQKDHELTEAFHVHEAETTRLNLLIESKASEVKELTSAVQAVKIEHDAERRELEAAYLAATSKELERYQELHSVSNADWSVKEEELSNQVKELSKASTEWQEQERALKSTIKSQLASNGRLVATNKALKADGIEKLEAIAALESAKVRLESRVALLEKERVHFSTQGERKRDAGSGLSSYSSQLSTQVSLVTAELEKVLKENTELQWKLGKCRCGESARRSGTSDSGQKAKNCYLTRIQQLEHDKQQVEHKRRELLLVNAKLIQEQKQLHVKNASLSNEVHELQESVNHWRLRDERRRKNEGQPSLPRESELNLSSPLIRKASASSKDQSPSSQDDLKSDLPASRKQNVIQGAVTPATSNAESYTRSTMRGSRKRKLDEDFTTPGPTNTDSSELPDANAVVAKASSEPRSRRRLSHFLTRGLASDKNEKQQADRPSECKQQ